MHALQELCPPSSLPATINNVFLTLFRIFKLEASLLTCILHYRVSPGHIRVMLAHHGSEKFNYACCLSCAGDPAACSRGHLVEALELS